MLHSEDATPGYRAAVPEGIEVELYRRAARRTEGRVIEKVDCFDPMYPKGGASPGDLDSALRGALVGPFRRRGKLLLLDAVGPNGAATLGLRFGMTGRLVVDGHAPIDELLYTTTRADPAYVRFSLRFDDGGELSIVDPRRLGSVELEPDEERLGPDAFDIDADALAAAVRGGRGALKSRLLDQSRLAGIGNLICDETLWRCGLSPIRPAGSLEPAEIDRLAAAIRDTMAELLERGGSHMGDLQEERNPAGRCPVDGAILQRSTVGGRTTYWCRGHQR